MINTKGKVKRSGIEFEMLINEDGEVDDDELERFVDEEDEEREVAI